MNQRQHHNHSSCQKGFEREGFRSDGALPTQKKKEGGPIDSGAGFYVCHQICIRCTIHSHTQKIVVQFTVLQGKICTFLWALQGPATMKYLLPQISLLGLRSLGPYKSLFSWVLRISFSMLNPTFQSSSSSFFSMVACCCKHSSIRVLSCDKEWKFTS